MFIGGTVLIRIQCPSCGTVGENYQVAGSDFFLLKCVNEECRMCMVDVLIEKKTHTVISMSQNEFTDDIGQRWRAVYKKVPAKENN